MPRPRINLDDKIIELRSVLQRYNGLPSQTEDRAAYANIKYYVQKYADDPRIKSLVDEFNIKIGNNSEGRAFSFDEKYNEIVTALNEIGRIPSISENQSLYTTIRYFFKKFESRPEVTKLKFIYAHSSCYPLPEDRVNRPEYNRFALVIGGPYDYTIWKTNSAFAYIKYVYDRFHELPARETKPMQELEKGIDKWFRFQDKGESEFKKLICYLVETGYKDSRITEIYNSFSFDCDAVHQRINNLLIQHGACTVHYLAQVAIPGKKLPSSFVYYFYYKRFNDDRDFRGISPLGELFSYEDCSTPLYVHYRHLDKCNIEAIKSRVLLQDRDWEKEPPKTILEWEQYGEYLFFIPYKTSDWRFEECMTLSKPFPLNCMEIGCPYFRYYKTNATLKYLDYKLYLLKNGYSLDKLTQDYLLDELNPKELSETSFLRNDKTKAFDIPTAYNVVRISENVIVDNFGGLYIKDDNDYILLFAPLDCKKYSVDTRTTVISSNAFLTCTETLEEVNIGNQLRRIGSSLSICVNLKRIIIPIYKVKEYCFLFSKKHTSIFFNSKLEPISTPPIIEDNTLKWVPYITNFVIPNGITEISSNAFSGCPIIELTIPGSIEEIHNSILWCNHTILKVTILEGVMKLWGPIFGKCENLIHVELPKSLHSLYNTFEDCQSLKSIHISSNDFYIGYNSFKGCKSLISVVIDGSLRELDNGAFSGCDSLKSIEFNHGIWEVGGAFNNCKNLETIYFRGDYEHFGYGFGNFYDCPNLKAIYVSRKNYDLFASKMAKKYLHLLKIEEE